MSSILKRPAAAASPVEKKKSKAEKVKKVPVPKRDPSIVAVAKGIALVDVPESVRTMIDDMLDFSLAAFADQRDKYMQEVVTLVGGVLTSHAEKSNATIAALQSQFDEGEKSRDKQQDVVDSLNTELESHQPILRGKLEKLAEAALAFRQARQVVETMTAEIEVAQQEHTAANHSQAELQAAFSDIFRPLCEGQGQGDKIKVDQLCSVLRSANFDSAMMNALPAVLVKEASSRGPFDAMVLKQVETEVSSRTASFNDQAAAFASVTAEREAKLSKARKLFEGTKEAQIAKADALRAVQAQESDIHQKLQDAKQSAADAVKKVRRFQKELATATTGLSKFTEGPLAAFKHLNDRTAPIETAEATPDTEAHDSTDGVEGQPQNADVGTAEVVMAV